MHSLTFCVRVMLP